MSLRVLLLSLCIWAVSVGTPASYASPKNQLTSKADQKNQNELQRLVAAVSTIVPSHESRLFDQYQDPHALSNLIQDPDKLKSWINEVARDFCETKENKILLTSKIFSLSFEQIALGLSILSQNNFHSGLNSPLYNRVLSSHYFALKRQLEGPQASSILQSNLGATRILLEGFRRAARRPNPGYFLSISLKASVLPVIQKLDLVSLKDILPMFFLFSDFQEQTSIDPEVMDAWYVAMASKISECSLDVIQEVIFDLLRVRAKPALSIAGKKFLEQLYPVLMQGFVPSDSEKSDLGAAQAIFATASFMDLLRLDPGVYHHTPEILKSYINLIRHSLSADQLADVFLSLNEKHPEGSDTFGSLFGNQITELNEKGEINLDLISVFLGELSEKQFIFRSSLMKTILNIVPNNQFQIAQNLESLVSLAWVFTVNHAYLTQGIHGYGRGYAHRPVRNKIAEESEVQVSLGLANKLAQWMSEKIQSMPLAVEGLSQVSRRKVYLMIQYLGLNFERRGDFMFNLEKIIRQDEHNKIKNLIEYKPVLEIAFSKHLNSQKKLTNSQKWVQSWNSKAVRYISLSNDATHRIIQPFPDGHEKFGFIPGELSVVNSILTSSNPPWKVSYLRDSEWNEKIQLVSENKKTFFNNQVAKISKELLENVPVITQVNHALNLSVAFPSVELSGTLPDSIVAASASFDSSSSAGVSSGSSASSSLSESESSNSSSSLPSAVLPVAAVWGLPEPREPLSSLSFSCYQYGILSNQIARKTEELGVIAQLIAHLTISGCLILNEDLNQIVAHFKNLKGLSIERSSFESYSNPLYAEKMLAPIGNLSSLEYLKISLFNGVTEVGLHPNDFFALAHLTSLKELHLEGFFIDRIWIDSLSSIQSIESLHLVSSVGTDELKYMRLGSFSRLKHIDLSRSTLTACQLVHVFEVPTLESFNTSYSIFALGAEVFTLFERHYKGGNRVRFQDDQFLLNQYGQVVSSPRTSFLQNWQVAIE